MVDSPKIRHSKPRRDPVTIDLDAEPAAVQAKSEETAAKDAAAAENHPLLDEVPPVPPKADKAEAGPMGGSTSSSRPEQAPPSSTLKQEPRRGGVSAVAAGLIGAVIALAGAGGLQMAGVLPTPGGSATNAEIEGLKGEIAGLRDQIGAAPAASSTEQLTQQVDQLTVAMDEALSKLETATSSAVPAVDTGAIDQRFQDIEAKIASLGQQAGSVDLAPLTQRIDALEASVGEARQAASGVADLQTKLSAIETRLADLDSKLAEQAAQPGAALAIAASALKAAVDRGDPFMTELETYAAVSPQSPEIEALRGMAASGVPARTTIENSFPDAANAMVAAAKPTDPDAGFLDRLMSSAQSLVQVRPVGMIEGDGAPAITARMEVALKKGDYATVLSEYETLPEASKAAGAEFIAAVKARHAADDLVGTILSAALKA